MILKHHFKKFEKMNHIFKKNLDSSHDSDGLNFVESTRDLAANELKQGLSDLRDGIENNQSLKSLQNNVQSLKNGLQKGVDHANDRLNKNAIPKTRGILKNNGVAIDQMINKRRYNENWQVKNKKYAEAIGITYLSDELIQDHVRELQKYLNFTQSADLKVDGKFGNGTMAELLHNRAVNVNRDEDVMNFEALA